MIPQQIEQHFIYFFFFHFYNIDELLIYQMILFVLQFEYLKQHFYIIIVYMKRRK